MLYEKRSACVLLLADLTKEEGVSWIHFNLDL
jgi:hypothetical protein